MKFTAISEKIGSFGTIISAFGCASCFPVIGSLGAMIGLGFLAKYEGLFMNTLLPLFTVIALVSLAMSWWSHRQHFRGILGIAGPLLVLVAIYLLRNNWSTYVFYMALALMLVVGLWNLVSPPDKKCALPQ